MDQDESEIIGLRHAAQRLVAERDQAVAEAADLRKQLAGLIARAESAVERELSSSACADLRLACAFARERL